MTYQLDFGALLQYLGFFLEGTAVTIGLTAFASLFGISIGIAGAAAMGSKIRWLRKLVAGYVELIRNTPFIVQMFFFFFGLPSLGLRLSALAAAALAMTINLAAYAIEIMRAGLEGVPIGQSEAARSLGLRPLAWSKPNAHLAGTWFTVTADVDADPGRRLVAVAIAAGLR